MAAVCYFLDPWNADGSTVKDTKELLFFVTLYRLEKGPEFPEWMWERHRAALYACLHRLYIQGALMNSVDVKLTQAWLESRLLAVHPLDEEILDKCVPDLKPLVNKVWGELR